MVGMTCVLIQLCTATTGLYCVTFSLLCGHTFRCFLPAPAPLESMRTQAPTLRFLIPLHATLSTFYYKITLPFTSLRMTHFRISEGGQKIVPEPSQWTVGKFAHFYVSVIFSWVPLPQHILLSPTHLDEGEATHDPCHSPNVSWPCRLLCFFAHPGCLPASAPLTISKYGNPLLLLECKFHEGL